MERLPMSAQVVAVLHADGDTLFHTDEWCDGIDSYELASYRVTRAERALDSGKTPCPSCWSWLGYRPSLSVKVGVR